MSDKNEHRLFKVARELNLSSGSIVEFLHKQGHTEVVEDLNGKINNPQYELLLKQFAPDKLTKIKAEDMAEYGTQSRPAPRYMWNADAPNAYSSPP